MNNSDKVIKRLEYLASMIGKYAHRWSETPSYRLVAWVDEYNQLKAQNRPAFVLFCEKHGYCPTHTGHDVLA